MPLKLYADECVDARIVAGLRRRGVDVVSAADEGFLGAPDERHLERAADLDRVIVTADHDFLEMLHARFEGGQGHPGVAFILPRTEVGAAVHALVLLALVFEPRDVVDRVEWIP